MNRKKDLQSEAREILGATRVVRRGAQSEQISLLGAILLAQAERALQGNDRAAKVVLEFGLHCGVFKPSPPVCSLDLTKLDDQEDLPSLERMIAKAQTFVREEDDA
ncbi:hypothetical protein ACVWWO_007066 [Bradyrhizobium sp. F1.13.1]